MRSRTTSGLRTLPWSPDRAKCSLAKRPKLALWQDCANAARRRRVLCPVDVRRGFRAESGNTIAANQLAGFTYLGIVAVVASTLGWGVPSVEATFPFSVTVKNSQRNEHKLKDFTVEVIGIPKIDGIDEVGPFTQSGISRNGKAVKFDGGAIAPGSSGTVVIDLDQKIPRQQGFAPLVIEETSWSSDPLEFGVSNMIFSGAIAKGDALVEPPGIIVLPGEYLYVYQFEWAGIDGGATGFEVALGGGEPTSIGVLEDTWTSASLLPEPGLVTVDDEGFISGANWTLLAAMLPENLTGVAGVAPLNWDYVNGRMIAEFAPLANGDVSSVLWFTHPMEPSFGGPLGLAMHNAAMSVGGTDVFSAAAVAPVPEPSAFFLVVIGSAFLVMRRTPQRWNVRHFVFAM